MEGSEGEKLSVSIHSVCCLKSHVFTLKWMVGEGRREREREREEGRSTRRSRSRKEGG